MKPRQRHISASLPALAAGTLALLLSAVMINHGLTDSILPAGAGLTVDESFNIDQGIYLSRALEQHGPLILSPQTGIAVFRNYLPDHPPLVRLEIGMAHDFLGWLIPGSENVAYNVPAARLGACLAFAMMTALLCRFTIRHYGLTTGIFTALLVIGSPRLIGHARLAALESGTNLAWVMALLPLLAWWTADAPPTRWRAVVSGCCWGLLLLSKIQAVLLAPAVLIWGLSRFRIKSIMPLTLWGLSGIVVLFACWPWLWDDPLANFLQYLGRTTDRQTLYCWYLGERFADKDIPWHFPTVMLASSLSAWTVAGLLLRFRCGRPDRCEQLLLLTSGIPVLVFSLPGVPVYDGIRLFLVALPGLCVVAARGYAGLFLCRSKSSGSASQRGPVLVTQLLLLLLPLPWTLQPFAINQYGPLCGGNRGAAKLGFEAGFWADALNGDFWIRIPENTTLYVAPVSHEFQLPALQQLVPILQQRNIDLQPWHYDSATEPGPLLLIHRLADLRPELQRISPEETQLARAESAGMVLARAIEQLRSED